MKTLSLIFAALSLAGPLTFAAPVTSPAPIPSAPAGEEVACGTTSSTSAHLLGSYTTPETYETAAEAEAAAASHLARVAKLSLNTNGIYCKTECRDDAGDLFQCTGVPKVNGGSASAAVTSAQGADGRWTGSYSFTGPTAVLKLKCQKCPKAPQPL